MFTENLRAGYRSLRSTPGFALTAVLSLAIGIGGSVSMFTLVNSIVLKPLAYSEADRLVVVTNLTPGIANVPVLGLVPLQFIRWRKEIRSFESLAVAAPGTTMNLTGSGQPETLNVMRITSGLFETLRVGPRLGRWFNEAEEKRGMPNVAILSDSLWRRRFAAAPDIIGREILLNDTPYEIVGITPPGLRLFRGNQLNQHVKLPDRSDVFVPIRFTENDEQGGFHPSYVAIARLKPGVTIEQGRAELDSTLPTFSLQVPFLQDMNTRVGMQSLHTALVRGVSRSLLLLLISVGLVLLIACANVANLSLVRTVRRSRELAIRVALGANKRNLIGFLLMESFLLALGGSAAGAILSMWITNAVIWRAPAEVPRLEETAFDARVFLFAVAVCALTTVLCGLLPAWRASRTDPQQALNAGARGNTDSSQSGRLRSLLVGAEVALGTLLVIGAGLLLSSFYRVINVPRGFDGHDIMIVDLLLPSPRYQDVDKQAAFVRAAHDVIASIPAVMNVAVNSRLPLLFETRDAALAEGHGDICSSLGGCSSKSGPEILKLVAWPSVSAEYFGAMRIPLRAGRLFRDDGEVEPVAVLSESAARSLWPGENPLGKRVSRPVTEPPGVYWRVVGIVGDVRSGGLDRAPTPAVYRPYGQKGGTLFSLVIRAAVPPESLAKTVRQALGRVDPDVPVPEIRPMAQVIAESVQQREFHALLLSSFALLAVLLAAVGIYGVVAFSVMQRRKEIALRLALGARAEDLHRMIIRSGMAPVCAGLGAGLLAAAFLARLIASLLFEVRPLDPLIFIGALLILVFAAAIPCWLSARQASRIDPILALRLE